MAPTPAAPSRRDVQTFLGPFLFGGMVASLLLGVQLVLTGIYFKRFPRDPLLHRGIILLFAAASLLSWGTTLYLLDYAFIQNFGSPSAMHAWPRIVVLPILLPAVSALLSQVLFGARVWKFSDRSPRIGLALLLLIGSSAASGILAIVVQPDLPKLGINGGDVRYFAALGVRGMEAPFRRTILACEVFLWVSCATDCFISLALAHQLLKRRSAVRNTRVDTLLARIVAYGVTTGGLTAAYTLAMAVIILLTTSENNIEIGLALQQTLIYGIVCVGSLVLRPADAGKAAATSTPSQSSRYTTRARHPNGPEGFELEKVPSGRSHRWHGFPEKDDMVEQGLRVQVRAATTAKGDGEKFSPVSPGSYASCSPGSYASCSPISPPPRSAHPLLPHSTRL